MLLGSMPGIVAQCHPHSLCPRLGETSTVRRPQAVEGQALTSAVPNSFFGWAVVRTENVKKPLLQLPVQRETLGSLLLHEFHISFQLNHVLPHDLQHGHLCATGLHVAHLRPNPHRHHQLLSQHEAKSPS